MKNYFKLFPETESVRTRFNHVHKLPPITKGRKGKRAIDRLVRLERSLHDEVYRKIMANLLTLAENELSSRKKPDNKEKAILKLVDAHNDAWNDFAKAFNGARIVDLKTEKSGRFTSAPTDVIIEKFPADAVSKKIHGDDSLEETK